MSKNIDKNSFDASGTGVAIITPFNNNGEVDYKSLKKLVNYLIDSGINYLVVHGTTGEAATLSLSEKIKVLEEIKVYAKERVNIVLGIGGNNTAEVLASFKSYDFKGVSAILSVSPYYNKPSQEGIYQHFAAIAKVSPVPIILYNVPSRTGANVSAETTIKLASKFANIIATKEASGNIEQCMTIIANKPKGFELVSGDDNLTLPLIACGAKGVISVVAMANPKDFASMVTACLKGDFEKAKQLHYKIMPITNLIFADGNPGGIKAVLKMKGITNDVVRLPLVGVNSSVLKELKKVILNFKQ